MMIAEHCTDERSRISDERAPVGGWPRTVRGTPTLLADFQRLLRSMGVQLEWSAEIQTSVR